jgi:autotransporter-associated beta strand protein
MTSIIKTGTNTLLLTGANIYSGTTTVSNGVLLITGTTSNGAVNIYGGTLGGSGIISGPVFNQSGGNIAPGATTNLAGTVLTISNAVTLLAGSTNIMQVSHVPSIKGNTNDQIVSSGVITYGGTLMIITNAGDTTKYNVGDNFTLFNAAGYSGSFASIQPPLGTNLTWSNNVANRGNFIVITNTVVTPPAPVAGFTATTITNIFVTQFVAFTNTSTGSFTNAAWSFGDGNVATNTGGNVTNTYSSAGTYTVQLIVAGAGGSSTNAQVNYIVVKAKPVLGKPVVSGGNFILSGTNGPAGQVYRILSSTNVALPVINWTPVFTNVFAPDGSYTYTNSPLTSKATFFKLVSP